MIRKFGSDDRGTIAIIFAFTFIPVVFMAGLCLDSLRAYYMQQRMGTAIDAAVIAGAQVYRETGDEGKMRATATAYFHVNITDEKRYDFNPTFVANESTMEIVGTANMELPTTFTKIMRIDFIPIRVSGTAQASGVDLEMSVMLDITGSMDEYSGKKDRTKRIEDLQAALGDLIGLFEDQMAKKKARIAFAPFSEAVNLGSKVDKVRATSPKTTKVGKDTWKLSTCVTERVNNRYTDAFGNLGPHYSEKGSCAAASQPVPLTYDKATLLTAVQGLKTGGSTAGHLGTAWAWYMISPEWKDFWGVNITPYKERNVMKAAILMTDGEYNIQYCDGVPDSQKSCSSIGSNTQARAVCSAMKEKGIIVYTVGFDIDTKAARETLEQCASPGKYYSPFDGDGIRAAFIAIGKDILAQVRLSK